MQSEHDDTRLCLVRKWMQTNEVIAINTFFHFGNVLRNLLKKQLYYVVYHLLIALEHLVQVGQIKELVWVVVIHFKVG